MASRACFAVPTAEVTAVGLAVTGAGWVTEQVEERTARRSEYAGVLVTDVNGGPGHLMLGGAGSRRVRAPGAFLWLPAEMVHSYGPGKGSWTEHWVVFHGPAVAHYEGLGLLDGGPTPYRSRSRRRSCG